MDSTIVKNTKQIANNVNQNAEILSEKFKEGVKVISKKAEKFDYDDLARTAESGYEASLSFVKKYPLYSILGATAVGLVAGAFLRGLGRD